MNIYENIIVGNFLFGFGVKMGISHHRAPVNPVSINLLQQTPLDQRLGDVVLANAKIFRLIEFKRKDNKSTKERGKWRMISDVLRQSTDMNALSRKIHWYVNSDFRPLGADTQSKIEVMSYLDFLEPRGCITLPEFIDETAKEATSSVVDEGELWLCKRYVELVASVFGDPSKNSGCLLFTVAGEGQLQYVAVDDIGDLIRSPRQIIELTLERHRERERKIQRDRELRPREQSLERSR